MINFSIYHTISATTAEQQIHGGEDKRTQHGHLSDGTALKTAARNSSMSN